MSVMEKSVVGSDCIEMLCMTEADHTAAAGYLLDLYLSGDLSEATRHLVGPALVREFEANHTASLQAA